jgi:hypothetical protein
VRKRIYVPLAEIARAVIQSLKRRYPAIACDRAVYNDASAWGRLNGAITAINGWERDDVEGRALLAAWTRRLPFWAVIRAFIQARRRIAGELGIVLKNEPPPVFLPPGRRVRKRTILRQVRKCKDLRFARYWTLEKILLKTPLPLRRKGAATPQSRRACRAWPTGSPSIIIGPSSQPGDPIFPPGSRVGDFIIGEPLRSTRHSLIYHATSITDSGKFVFKYIRAEVPESHRQREIDAIAALVACPNSVDGFDVVEVSGSVGYFMPEYIGGDLHSLLTESQLDENAVRAISFRMLESLEYLHSAHFVHRDFKPQHIFLTGDPHFPVSFLGGFGLFVERPEGDLLNAYAGIDAYSPPEVFRREGYKESADMWAFGITLINMMARVDPFPDPKKGSSRFQAAINKEGYAQRALAPVNPSDEFRDLVARLVTPDQHHRLKAQEALSHPFYAMGAGLVAAECAALIGIASALRAGDFAALEFV